MIIIPAIDIQNGKCVRLTQGDFARLKIYNDDPVAVAKQWEKDGAKMIHLVDLDGAKNGDLSNFATIKKITKALSIPVQVGGGIRNKESVESLLSAGVFRVILGTVALENGTLLKEFLKEFSSHIAVALDTKQGQLMKHGWFGNSGQDTFTTAQRLVEQGVKRFIYTDVVKDGTLTEPNYPEIEKLTKAVGVPVIASGGISDIADIKKLQVLGVEGVILGKSLYEKKIDLREALNVS